MQYAILNNERIKAYKTGLIASCPVREGQVRAKCGLVRIHHWAHISKQQCDPWKEDETEWHRTWKEYFPEEWREVVVTDEQSNKRHRADIKTAKGLVIEIQNSSILLSEAKEREHFYN